MIPNLKKVIIGTAHFGTKYGINGKKENFENIKNIINYLNKNRVEIIFDCSDDYQNSFKFLKKLIKKKRFKFKIIYKIKINKNLNNKKTLENFLLSKIKKISSFFNLNYKNIILMSHNENIINNKNLYLLHEVLVNFKKKKNIYNFGYSIYNFQKLKKKIFSFKPDVLQLPFNIADRSVSNNDLVLLKKRNIKIHVRSIFLQGLLMTKSNELPKRFMKFKKYWKIFENNLEKFKMNREDCLLDHVFNNKIIDNVVIGYTNVSQLKLIKKIKSQNSKNLFPKIKSSSEKKYLLRPYNW